MQASLMRPSVAALFFSGAVTGCAYHDYQAEPEAYEADYASHHTFEVHTVTRSGHDLHVRVFPAQASSGKPTILLLHGFPDTSHLYDRLAPLLAGERRVVTFDFLGWGRSDKPSDHEYDAASLLADLDAVIAYLGAQTVMLVAHDISGFPVIDRALAHPARIDRLVLLNTIYSPSRAAVPPAAIARFSTPGVRREISVFLSSTFDSIWQRSYLEQVGQFFCDGETRAQYLKVFVAHARESRRAFFGLNRVLISEVSSRKQRVGDMQTFDKPVSIIFGAEDQNLNAGVARELDALFPNSELHLIDGACHYVQLDAPEAVARLILEPSHAI